jgi:hypothetical protein
LVSKWNPTIIPRMIDHIFPETLQHAPLTKAGNLPQSGLDIPNILAAVPTAPREERRQHCRARVTLRMRIRSADFSDGQLQQIAQTINTSRRGFYFHTEHGHFREGMRLRIVVPYHESHNTVDGEETAEVIRIDDRTGFYGIAIVRANAREAQPVVSKEAHPVVEHYHPSIVQAASAQASHSSRAQERRTHQRTSLIATVELTDLQTGMVTRARTSDVSMSGCYVDTLNPLPSGSAVALLIEKGGENLKVQASVRIQFQGSGMGVAFEDLSAEQCEIVKSWLVG